MENGIQDQIRDIRIFGHAVRINKCPNNDAKSNQQSIAIIFGQICNNLHGRYFGVFRHQRWSCQTRQNGFKCIKAKKIEIKTEKCRFHVQKVTFLGFVIIPGNIQMETTKIDSIQIWPTLKNTKDAQKLLRFIRFYQNMIPRYAEWILSMTDFLQKNKKFEWGPDQVLGLAKLKKHFVTNRPLTMHDPEKQRKLQTDVSNKAIGAMVFQQKKPLDYYSKS